MDDKGSGGMMMGRGANVFGPDVVGADLAREDVVEADMAVEDVTGDD